MKNLFILITVFLTLTGKAQTTEEFDMVNFVNQLRVMPKSFVPYVEAYIEKQESLKLNGGMTLDTTKVKIKVIRVSAKNVKLRDELIAEAKALIIFLNYQTPVRALKLNNELYGMAKSHAKFLDSTNTVSHIGSNGQTFGDRTKGLTVLENVCSIKANDNVIDCLIQLLLDYGLTDKGHRKNLFNENAKQITVAKSGKVWVQEFIYTLK